MIFAQGMRDTLLLTMSSFSEWFDKLLLVSVLLIFVNSKFCNMISGPVLMHMP